jgi:hypothetical protein
MSAIDVRSDVTQITLWIPGTTVDGGGSAGLA